MGGTWQWVSCKDTFTVWLSFIDTTWKSKVTNDSFGPKIYGWHRYVENGIEIESSFPLSSGQPPFSKGIMGMVMNSDSTQLWFNDITRKRTFRVNAEMLDSSGTSMRWVTHRPQETWYRPNEGPKILGGQTIPSPLILHKISD